MGLAFFLFRSGKAAFLYALHVRPFTRLDLYRLQRLMPFLFFHAEICGLLQSNNR